jgi:penicillin-binding protein-related factor A (putative recombinase)
MKTPSLKEKQIENSILSYLKLRGLFFYKQETVGIFDSKKGVYRRKNSIHRKVGVSDIIGVINGRAVFIEVKSAKGKLSPGQVQFLEEAKQNGAITIVARSIEDVEHVLGDIYGLMGGPRTEEGAKDGP